MCFKLFKCSYLNLLNFPEPDNRRFLSRGNVLAQDSFFCCYWIKLLLQNVVHLWSPVFFKLYEPSSVCVCVCGGGKGCFYLKTWAPPVPSLDIAKGALFTLVTVSPILSEDGAFWHLPLLGHSGCFAHVISLTPPEAALLRVPLLGSLYIPSSPLLHYCQF